MAREMALACAGDTQCAEERPRIHWAHSAAFTLAVLVAAALLAAVPQVSWALDWSTLGDALGAFFGMGGSEAITNILATVLREWANSMFAAQAEFTNDLLSGTIYTSFTNLLGGADNVYSFAVDVCGNIARSVGYTIMTVCFLAQILKLGSRAGSGDAMPMVKDLVMVLIVFMIMKFFVDNAAGICQLLFSVAAYGMRLMSGVSQAGLTMEAYSLPDDFVNMPQILTAMVVAMLGFGAAATASVVSNVLIWARGLQLYAMLAFSSIPLALIGTDETRGFSLNFMRNYLAVCLSIAMMMFIFLMYPLVFSVVINTGAEGYGGILNVVGGLQIDWGGVFKGFVVYFLLIYALVKSGSWSKEVLGG